jgi:hypothetical protein
MTQAAGSVWRRGEFGDGGVPVLAAVAGWPAAGLPDFIGPASDLFVRHILTSGET